MQWVLNGREFDEKAPLLGVTFAAAEQHNLSENNLLFNVTDSSIKPFNFPNF